MTDISLIKPDKTLSANEVFGIDSDLQVPAVQSAKIMYLK